MNDLLRNAILKEEITDNDIADALYEICDHVHSSCDSNCPIYNLYGEVPKDWDDWNCAYFKNGHKMLRKLREAKESFN